MYNVSCLRQLSDKQLLSKRVLIRVDFNVPIHDHKITDDTRIRAALKSIKYLISKNARVVLVSHLGRPKGKIDHLYSLKIVASHLSLLLNQEVKFISDCLDPTAKSMINHMANGQVVLLENLRFYSEEESNDIVFAKQLSEYGDLFVQDAFGTVHRSHASTHAITDLLPSYAGFLLEHELDVLSGLMNTDKKPVVAIVGGAKVSSKLRIIQNLLSFADTVLIGGAMAYTFLKAQGIDTGNSLVEDDLCSDALNILKLAKQKNVNLCLPIDHVVAKSLDDTKTEYSAEISLNQMGLDIGPRTREQYILYCKNAGMILWNGPMGVFETPCFSEGTRLLSKAICESPAYTVVGGGDSVAALNLFGGSDKIDHISTGGGAFLSVLEGNSLPGLIGLKTA